MIPQLLLGLSLLENPCWKIPCQPLLSPQRGAFKGLTRPRSAPAGGNRPQVGIARRNRGREGAGKEPGLPIPAGIAAGKSRAWPGPAASLSFITTASNSRSPPTPRSSRYVLPHFPPISPVFPNRCSRFFPTGIAFSSPFRFSESQFPLPNPQILQENTRCLQTPGARSRLGNLGQFWALNVAILG